MSLSLEGWSKGETAGPFREPRFAYLCWTNTDLNPFLFSFLSENKSCPLISELSKNNALPTFQSHQSYSLLSPHLISFIFFQVYFFLFFQELLIYDDKVSDRHSLTSCSFAIYFSEFCFLVV